MTWKISKLGACKQKDVPSYVENQFQFGLISRDQFLFEQKSRIPYIQRERNVKTTSNIHMQELLQRAKLNF